MLKITLEQSKKVGGLIRSLCCNYDEGNCLLLDDGEPCKKTLVTEFTAITF